jgi:hypothetical protein
MTAARHFDQYAAVPGHDEIVAMAPAAIYSCLGRGFLYTQVAIDRELADRARHLMRWRPRLPSWPRRCSWKPAAARLRPPLLQPAGPADHGPLSPGCYRPRRQRGLMSYSSISMS